MNVNFSQKEMLSSERGEKLAGLDSLRQQVKNKDRKKQTNEQKQNNKTKKLAGLQSLRQQVKIKGRNEQTNK